MTANAARTKRSRTLRGGVATVECAICLPIFVVITFATIDLCSAMFLKESLTLAAYEGARVGIQRGGTDTNADDVVKAFLTSRNIQFNTDAVQIDSPGFDNADTLEHVTLTVTVPCSGNMPLIGYLMRGRSLSAAVTIRKEFAN
jgi:Flp pilus assembly protein TadG